MSFQTVVTPEVVERHLDDPSWVLVDSRFSLGDPGRGRRDYEAAHVPGAVYAHLDEDLSGPVTPGRTGRHPLPEVPRLAHAFGRLGIGPDTHVVAYDDMGGGIAARLWWLLGWLGHDDVAVMDGGWQRWLSEGRPTTSGTESNVPRPFAAAPRMERIASVADVTAAQPPSSVLVDARAAERFRGEHEPIDAEGGHIPGAVSVPWGDNLDAQGSMRSPSELRMRYDALVGADARDVICYCGSGVTAAHDVLAMVHAGLPRPRLYPGSWSEWITDPARGRAVGP